MSASFTGEIRMFAGNYVPVQWAYCDGQLLATTANNALYSLIGSQYGGDGHSTFGLPEMRGRTPIGQGTGPGLSPRPIGQRAGQEYVTLTKAQIPTHTHTLTVSQNSADQTTPSNSVRLAKANIYADTPGASFQNTLNPASIAEMGSSSSHLNIMPSLVTNFIICMTGIYPTRS